MRIDTHTHKIELTPDLRRYAERRAWMAAGRHVPHVAWLGLWLTGHDDIAGDCAPRPATCRIDAWLRGRAGHATADHADDRGDIRAAIDVAAARLERAIARALRSRHRHAVAPRGFPSAARVASPTEVFLDFDPVFPGWPPAADRTRSRAASPVEAALNGGAL